VALPINFASHNFSSTCTTNQVLNLIALAMSTVAPTSEQTEKAPRGSGLAPVKQEYVPDLISKLKRLLSQRELFLLNIFYPTDSEKPNGLRKTKLTKI
jgi:hypothetical protein